MKVTRHEHQSYGWRISRLPFALYLSLSLILARIHYHDDQTRSDLSLSQRRDVNVERYDRPWTIKLTFLKRRNTDSQTTQLSLVHSIDLPFPRNVKTKLGMNGEHISREELIKKKKKKITKGQYARSRLHNRSRTRTRWFSLVLFAWLQLKDSMSSFTFRAEPLNGVRKSLRASLAKFFIVPRYWWNRRWRGRKRGAYVCQEVFLSRRPR